MELNLPIEECIKELGRYVLPICFHYGKTRSPFFIGSGIPIVFNDELYFATAAHVVDGAGEKQMWIAGNSAFIPLKGPQIRWKHISGSRPDYDLVVYKLEENDRKSIEPFYGFITEADVSVVDDPDQYTLFGFVGYPHSKNKSKPISPEEQVNFTSLFYLMNKLVPLNELKVKDKEQNVHFALKAPNKKAVSLDMQSKQPLISPIGISGCPVFRIQLDPNAGIVKHAHLVGLGIEHDKSQQVFIATRSEWVFYSVDQLAKKLKAVQGTPAT
jgi:hypothetical protein